MARYRLLIFDWDGTLMDSEQRIVESIREACADIGIEVPSEARARDVIGLGLAEAIERLLPDLPPRRHAELAERYRHHFLVANSTPTPLFPGVSEMLADLEAAGHLLAVATGKGRRGLDEALGVSGLAGRFHATRTAEETRSKPHPQMLEELLDLTGTEPADAVMVGDTEYDLAMARSIGMPSVGVSWGVHERPRLEAERPATIVDDLPTLHDWLQQRENT